MQVGCDMQWRYQRPHVFNFKCRFGRYAVRGQILVNRGPEKCPIDQEFERGRLFIPE